MNRTFDDLKHAWRQLKCWQTWLTLGLVALFLGLAWLIGKLAFGSDALQILLGHSATSCRELSHGAIVLVGCGMVFFAFAALLTLAEIRRWLAFRRRGAHAEAASTLTCMVGWSLILLTVAAAALFFFARYCR